MVLSTPATADARAASGRGFLALCEWAAGVKRETLPLAVTQRAALVLADDIAAIVASAEEPEVAAVHGQISATAAGRPEATLLARKAMRLDRYSAATGNGMAMCWAELDEGYRVVPCHAGAYIIPALIAEAEAAGAATRDVIAALAVAYEVTGRIAHAFPVKSLRVHPHGAFAPLGAAAGVAKLRGLGAKDLAAALSSAMSMSHAGPYNHATEGALARNAWTATGAWCGMRAVDWAPLGIGGLATTAFDVMATCYGHDAEPARLTANLGQEFAISNGYHKLIACCQYAHSAVEATLALKQRHAELADAAAIDRITVETHPMGATLAVAEPATVLGAKFSMLHAIATTAVNASAGAAAFARGSLADPQVRRLRSRITLAPFAGIKPWPNDRPARVTIEMGDGRSFSQAVESARGGPDSPFAMPELMAKIGAQTGGLYPAMPGWLERMVAAPGDQAGAWAADIQAAAVQRS